MKFTDVVIVFVMLTLIECSALKSFSVCMKMAERKTDLMMQVTATHFVSESFKNSCRGKGFETLNGWQKACRAMWKLDYIAWADAEDFMNVPKDLNSETLFYGRWIGKNFNGEVYCRKTEKAYSGGEK